jgi:hypothetical protein
MLDKQENHGQCQHRDDDVVELLAGLMCDRFVRRYIGRPGDTLRRDLLDP